MLTVSDAGLGDDDVITRWQREERHHLPCNRMICYVQWFLLEKEDQKKKMNNLCSSFVYLDAAQKQMKPSTC